MRCFLLMNMSAECVTFPFSLTHTSSDYLLCDGKANDWLSVRGVPCHHSWAALWISDGHVHWSSQTVWEEQRAIQTLHSNNLHNSRPLIQLKWAQALTLWCELSYRHLLQIWHQNVPLLIFWMHIPALIYLHLSHFCIFIMSKNRSSIFSDFFC